MWSGMPSYALFSPAPVSGSKSEQPESIVCVKILHVALAPTCLLRRMCVRVCVCVLSQDLVSTFAFMV